MATFRDNTLEAISDGLYVSPAIETADYHASLNKNSWFYVFDYQSKYGDYTTVHKHLIKVCLLEFKINFLFRDKDAFMVRRLTICLGFLFYQDTLKTSQDKRRICQK